MRRTLSDPGWQAGEGAARFKLAGGGDEACEVAATVLTGGRQVACGAKEEIATLPADCWSVEKGPLDTLSSETAARSRSSIAGRDTGGSMSPQND
jgi:hypothetical protein